MAAGAFLELLGGFERQPYHGHSKAMPVVAEKLRTLDEFAQATYTVTFSPGQEAPRSTRDGPQSSSREWCKPARDRPRKSAWRAAWAARTSELQAPRSVKSVQELLRLWRQGWGEIPSVDSLERDWGARWRPSAEKNYSSTRKIIVDEVRRRAQSDGLTEDIVARQMDEERGGPSSLDKLFKAIRKDRQGEKGHKRASGQFNVGGSEKSMAQ
ncbi:transcriptional activator of glycolytic enzymes domain-containing protein [Hirsutella rhossiliensis]